MPLTEIESIQRTFIIGDEWLYFKFYAGVKTTESLLKHVVLPVTESLYSKKIIDQWFFIRYSDPKLHLRVRFHCTNPEQLNDVILAVNNAIKTYVEKKLVWNIQIDTYQREIERYGRTSMLLSEKFFWHDSVMIANVINQLEGDNAEVLRWQFGIKSIDELLNSFDYNLKEKLDILVKLRSGYGKDFGIDTSSLLRKQLSKKYRENQKAIESILDTNQQQEAELTNLLKFLQQRSTATKEIIKKIFELQHKKQLTLALDNLLMSYIHMTCNRLFISKQRLNEMALYDFLVRYYKSQVARST